MVTPEMVGDSCDGGKDGCCHRFSCGGRSSDGVDVFGRDCR